MTALQKAGRPELGEAVKADRKSALTYLAVRAPNQRKILKTGFSFYELEEREILDVWDDLWTHSPYYDVMAAAVEYYGQRVCVDPKRIHWTVFRHWSGREENWALRRRPGGNATRGCSNVIPNRSISSFSGGTRPTTNGFAGSHW
ncbi:MAG: hypothetical protein CME05_07110 [Gemmatimonadaceae bacterium]|nr:hypothetical protein [Gemmatimonadaceae bacterium]